MFKKNLAFFSGIARDLLAIFGVIGVVYAIFNYPSSTLDSLTGKLKQLDAYAKPTCEPLASLKVKYSDGSPAEARLIGITIQTINDIHDISFRFGGITYIKSWAIASDGLSESKANEIIKALPVGEIDNRIVSGKISGLASDTKTTIQLQGVASKNFLCTNNDWFNLSSPNQKIANLEMSNFYMIRGMKYQIKGNIFDSFYKWLSFILIIILLGIIMKMAMKPDQRKERFRITKKGN
jgi:hypothetical protein